MSAKEVEDKKKSGWPLTARQKRRKLGTRGTRKKDRHKSRGIQVQHKGTGKKNR